MYLVSRGNFGLKSGVPVQENEAPFGPETRGEENGEEVSPPHFIGGLGERRELSQRGPRRPYRILSPQMTSVDSRRQQLLHI